MPAQQPTLDGTLPIPASSLSYAEWVDLVRPAFVEAASAGRRFTSYEIARDHWGNFVQSLVRDHVIEHCGWDETIRPGGEHSGVKVWRGTRAAQAGHAA
jgi:hypothetical protein